MLHKHGLHPYVVQMLLWGLWSLNERACGRPGMDLPEPSQAWTADCLLAVSIEAEALEEELEEFRRRTRGEEWE